MIRNYFTILFRQLWRNKLFTTLNILGLSIGIAAAWIIFRMVAFEYSYDKKQPDSDRIYQVVVRNMFEGKEGSFGGVASGLLPVLLKDVSGLEKVAPMYYQFNDAVSVVNDQGVVNSTITPSRKMIATTTDFFALLDYQWLAGDPATALESPDQIVLTQTRAAKYFPDVSPENLLGRVITFNDTTSRQISGILKDLEYLNSFEADEFIPLSQENLTNDFWGGYTSSELMYVKLAKNVRPQQLLDQINAINTAKNKEDFAKYNFKSWYDLYPLKDKHFAAEFGQNTRTADKKILYGLIAIGAFLLALGCINYINLSTALIPQRAKEIGIRKTLGSSPRNIIYRFLNETALITFFATLLAFGLSCLAVNALEDFIPSEMKSHVNYGQFAIFLILLIISITALSGIYPAWLITKVQTVNVLKGQVTGSSQPRKFNLRRGLIVFQFLVAQFFIVCALIIGQQLRYTMTKDMGFNKDAVITIDIPYKAYSKEPYKNKQFVLKEILEKNPDIRAVALGNRPMESNMNSNIVYINNDTGKIMHQLHIKHADTDLIPLYEMKLLAGRNLQPSDTMREFVINETAIKTFGLGTPENAIGKNIFFANNDKAYPIVGVVRDYHQFGIQSKFNPTGISSQKSRLSTVSIKLPAEHPEKWSSAIADIENNWNELYPGFDFKYRFYDEIIENMYKDEQKMSSLVKLATGISILISCLGLFGLATLTAYQRSKEIGIRKVLGASVAGIIQMLSKEFVLLISISILIASPLAWWAMNKWLESFAFRIDIQWWIFILAGLIAIVFAMITVSFQSVKAAVANPVDSLRDE